MLSNYTNAPVQKFKHKQNHIQYSKLIQIVYAYVCPSNQCTKLSTKYGSVPYAYYVPQRDSFTRM